MQNLFSIHCIHYSDAELEKVRNSRRRTIEFQVIVILCLHFHFMWTVFYQTLLLTFEMVDMRRELVPVYIEEHEPDSIFTDVGLTIYLQFQLCWERNTFTFGVGMMTQQCVVFFLIIVTLCINIGKLLNIVCLNSVFLFFIFLNSVFLKRLFIFLNFIRV